MPLFFSSRFSLFLNAVYCSKWLRYLLVETGSICSRLDYYSNILPINTEALKKNRKKLLNPFRYHVYNHVLSDCVVSVNIILTSSWKVHPSCEIHEMHINIDWNKVQFRDTLQHKLSLSAEGNSMFPAKQTNKYDICLQFQHVGLS